MAEVQNLQQKHLLLESEILSHDKVVAQLVTKAEQMVRSTHFAADDIKMTIGNLSEGYTTLRDISSLRKRMHELSNYFERFRSEMAAQKQRLLDQKAVIEFIHEADEVNEWINTQMAVAASEDYGKDVSHVEMLIKTFDSFLQTIHSSEERISRVQEISQRLLREDNSHK